MRAIYLVTAGKGTLVATVPAAEVADWLDLFGIEGESYAVREA